MKKEDIKVGHIYLLVYLDDSLAQGIFLARVVNINPEKGFFCDAFELLEQLPDKSYYTLDNFMCEVPESVWLDLWEDRLHHREAVDKITVSALFHFVREFNKLVASDAPDMTTDIVLKPEQIDFDKVYLCVDSGGFLLSDLSLVRVRGVNREPKGVEFVCDTFDLNYQYGVINQKLKPDVFTCKVPDYLWSSLVEECFQFRRQMFGFVEEAFNLFGEDLQKLLKTISPPPKKEVIHASNDNPDSLTRPA